MERKLNVCALVLLINLWKQKNQDLLLLFWKFNKKKTGNNNRWRKIAASPQQYFVYGKSMPTINGVVDLHYSIRYDYANTCSMCANEEIADLANSQRIEANQNDKQKKQQ